MKVLTDFLLLNEISTAFYNFDISFTSMDNNGSQKHIVNIVLINNLGYKALMVNSGIKHAFKYEKRH